MKVVREAPDTWSRIVGIIIMLAPILLEVTPLLYMYMQGHRREVPKKGEGVPTAADLVLRDESLARTTVTFQPGPLGCGIIGDGVVNVVLEDGQAGRAGVQIGWHVVAVAGEKPATKPKTQDLVKKYVGRSEPFTVTFLTESGVVEANVEALKQWEAQQQQEAAEQGREQAGAPDAGEKTEGDGAEAQD